MNSRYVAPAVSNSFNCPYSDCGALAHQTWFELTAETYKEGIRPLESVLIEELERLLSINKSIDLEREKALHFLKNISSGDIFIDHSDHEGGYGKILRNLDVCQCYSCKKFSVWNYGNLIFPKVAVTIQPNPDLPDDVKQDFLEAYSILNSSPRGSAALLRLCIQKICQKLGEKGKSIDDDIASLVKKGLDVKIQKALDIVRVIGNEAVHPGQMDLKDDLGTVQKLFDIVNIIAATMISQPKAIEELFQSLPEAKRKHIDDRDA